MVDHRVTEHSLCAVEAILGLLQIEAGLSICPEWNDNRFSATTGYALAPRHCIGFVVAKDSQRFSSGPSIRFLQENLYRGEPRILASYALIGAVLVLGGTGYALDKWMDTSPWFLVAGLLTGTGVGLYNLAKIVWRL